MNSHRRKASEEGPSCGAAQQHRTLADERSAGEAPLRTPHFVQWAGVEALTDDQSGPREILRVLRERRDVAIDLLDQIQTGVSFCTRLHFGRELPGEERRHVRPAYSGISAEIIREGLGRLKEWAQ